MNVDQRFAEIVDGVSDYIHGEARDAVVSGMAEAGEEMPGMVGALAYEITNQTAQRLSEEDPEMLALDVLLGVATEAIDMLLEIAHAMNLPTGDDDDLRGDALMKVMELHMAAVEDDPEERALAEQVMAEMIETGEFDQGMGYVNQRLQKEGVDPRQVQAQGHAIGAGGVPEPGVEGPTQPGIEGPQQPGLMGRGY